METDDNGNVVGEDKKQCKSKDSALPTLSALNELFYKVLLLIKVVNDRKMTCIFKLILGQFRRLFLKYNITIFESGQNCAIQFVRKQFRIYL